MKTTLLVALIISFISLNLFIIFTIVSTIESNIPSEYFSKAPVLTPPSGVKAQYGNNTYWFGNNGTDSLKTQRERRKGIHITIWTTISDSLVKDDFIIPDFCIMDSVGIFITAEDTSKVLR